MTVDTSDRSNVLSHVLDLFSGKPRPMKRVVLTESPINKIERVPTSTWCAMLGDGGTRFSPTVADTVKQR